MFEDLENMLNQMSREEREELFQQAHDEFMEMVNKPKGNVRKELDNMMERVKDKLPEYVGSKIGKQLTKIASPNTSTIMYNFHFICYSPNERGIPVTGLQLCKN